MARNLALVLTACYLTILSAGQNRTTIMAALPAMTSDLAFGPAQVEWIVNAYLLASAVFIILGGRTVRNAQLLLIANRQKPLRLPG
jgi:MFS family permease